MEHMDVKVSRVFRPSCISPLYVHKITLYIVNVNVLHVYMVNKTSFIVYLLNYKATITHNRQKLCVTGLICMLYKSY